MTEEELTAIGGLTPAVAGRVDAHLHALDQVLEHAPAPAIAIVAERLAPTRSHVEDRGTGPGRSGQRPTADRWAGRGHARCAGSPAARPTRPRRRVSRYDLAAAEASPTCSVESAGSQRACPSPRPTAAGERQGAPKLVLRGWRGPGDPGAPSLIARAPCGSVTPARVALETRRRGRGRRPLPRPCQGGWISSGADPGGRSRRFIRRTS